MAPPAHQKSPEVRGSIGEIEIIFTLPHLFSCADAARIVT